MINSLLTNKRFMDIESDGFKKAKEAVRVGETGKYALDMKGNVRPVEEIDKEREDKLNVPNQKPGDM